MLPTQNTLGYLSRFLGIFPDASFTFLNTVNHYWVEDPLMLLYSTKPTLFPIILICTMCAPSKLSTCYISHTVCPPHGPSGNVHAHVCIYKSSVLMTTPPQKLYTLPSRTYSFSSFFPVAIHCSAHSHSI